MDENRKLVELNIELSAEFSRYLFEHPEFSDRIPPKLLKKGTTFEL